MNRILIAGIGNIFLGDDAFGVEVVRCLARRGLPTEVELRDFGIRGYDLACALAEGYETVILVDATPQGELPGTVSLLEPDLAKLGSSEQTILDGHSLDPVRVLQMAETFGGRPARLYLVGCEPHPMTPPEGQMGLSDVVKTAVPKAAEMIESLVGNLLKSETIGTGMAPVSKEKKMKEMLAKTFRKENTARNAWIAFGGLVALGIVVMTVREMPSLLRELCLMRM